MTTLSCDDLTRENRDKTEESRCIEDFRSQGYEYIGHDSYYQKSNNTMLVAGVLFEDFWEGSDLPGYSLDANGKETPETLIENAFHRACGGHVACKITRVEGGYTFHVPNREVAREISWTLLDQEVRELCPEEIGDGDSAWRWKWEMLEKLVLCFIILCLLGKLFLYFSS